MNRRERKRARLEQTKQAAIQTWHQRLPQNVTPLQQQSYQRLLAMYGAHSAVVAGYLHALRHPPSPPKPKPLATEIVAAPIEAWRAWSVVEALPMDASALERMADAYDQGRNPFRELCGPFLAAVNAVRTWTGGEAACTQTGHAAPQPSCTCGYWAMRDRTSAEYVTGRYSGARVYGRVQLWGRIIEHRDGYRAQYAKPVELFVLGDHALADGLGRKYGCPASAVSGPTTCEDPLDAAYQRMLQSAPLIITTTTNTPNPWWQAPNPWWQGQP